MYDQPNLSCFVLQVLHRGILELDLSECEMTVEGMLLVSTFCPMLKTIDLGTSVGCRSTLTSRGTCTCTAVLALSWMYCSQPFAAFLCNAECSKLWISNAVPCWIIVLRFAWLRTVPIWSACALQDVTWLVIRCSIVLHRSASIYKF